MYTIKTNKQLKQSATNLAKSVKGLNKNIQQWLGDFLVSFNDNRDNTPFNTLMQSLVESKLDKSRVQIIHWIAEVSNYKVKYSKEKGFGVTYKDKEDKSFTPNEKFENTTFYTLEQEPKEKSSGYKNTEEAMKGIEKVLVKAMETEGMTVEMARVVFNRVFGL